MILTGAGGQQVHHPYFDASGTITTGGTPQLLLPSAKSRSHLFIQNLSDTDCYIEFGAARATCTISGGALASFSITNAGFGYTYPPDVELLGGGNGGNTAWLGVGAPGYPAPGDAANSWGRTTDLSGARPGKVHAVLTSNAVSSIAIEDPGAGYTAAPFVFITNSPRDPFGCAIPSATSGVWLPSGGGSYYMNGTACPTSAVSIFGATTGKAFCCKYMI